MASTNKTAYLRLNQWAADDSVLRDDFNQDNFKIDTAVNKRAVVLAETQTLTASASAVSVDLSDWDLSQYAEVVIDFFPVTSSGVSGGPMTSLRANNGTSVELARMSADGVKGLRIHLCMMPGGIGGSFTVPGTSAAGGFALSGVTASTLRSVQLVCGDSATYQRGTVCAAYVVRK